VEQPEETAMPEFELQTIDLVIAGLYIACIIGIGFWIGRGHKDADSFLSGKGMIWPVIGFSLMAANLSGTSYVGLAGAGYGEGIAVWNYEWIATIVLVFFALFILPYYIRSKINTLPQFLERRYDGRSKTVFSVFTILTAILIDSAGALFAGAITLQLLFPEMPLWTLVSLVAVAAGVYVIIGGLKAVMITDTIQGVILLAAGTFIFFMVFREFGWDWSAVRDAAPEDGWTIAPPPDDDFFPWPGIFTGAFFLGFYYWVANHMVVQKVLAAKSIDHGRMGALFAGFMQLPLLFILILPGLMGREIFPDLEDPDQIWPALVFDFLPVGIRGLMLAALIAALMSTLDSVLNGSASLVVNDFVRERRKDISDKKLLALSRILVGIFMILAALWAPVIATFGGIVEYFQSFLGHITMPVVVVFIGGFFWARPPRHAAYWVLLIGIPVGVAVFAVTQLFGLFELQFLYSTGIMFLFNLAIFLWITFTSEAPELENRKEVTWTAETWGEESRELAEKPWYLNYRYWGAAILALTLAMVVYFI
jgi:SSS family solute:Na+ symporter